MAVIADSDGKLYEQISFDLEDDFEKCVVSLADRIFGQSTIYVDVKKRMHGNGIISIPDGYVLDLADPQEPRLFIVENEIVSHDPFKHIGIQMLRFATSFDGAKNPRSQLHHGRNLAESRVSEATGSGLLGVVLPKHRQLPRPSCL